MARLEANDRTQMLPKDWRWVRFDEMAESITERVDNPSEAGVNFYVGLEHLDPDSLRIRRWGSPEDVAATKLRFEPGDIIFGRRRAYQRKVAVAEFEGICSAHALVLRARQEVVHKDFLPFFLQSDVFFDRALSISVGSLSPTINWRTLARQEFTLPPKPEQQRIASMLLATQEHREQLERVEGAVSGLILALGVQLLSPIGHDGILLGDLEESGELDLQTGPFGTVLKASSYSRVGTPLINPTHMSDGLLDVSNGPFLDDGEVRRLARYRLQPNDVVVGRKGDVGRAVLIDEASAGFILGSDCIRLRLRSHAPLSPRFLYRFIQSPPVRRWIVQQASGTTMPGINEKVLKRLVIPLVPVLEQERVVSIVDRAHGQLAQVRASVVATSRLMSRLREQSLSGAKK